MYMGIPFPCSYHILHRIDDIYRLVFKQVRNELGEAIRGRELRFCERRDMLLCCIIFYTQATSFAH